MATIRIAWISQNIDISKIPILPKIAYDWTLTLPKPQISSSRIQIWHRNRAKRTKTDPQIRNRTPKLTKSKIKKIVKRWKMLICPFNLYGIYGHTFGHVYDHRLLFGAALQRGLAVHLKKYQFGWGSSYWRLWAPGFTGRGCGGACTWLVCSLCAA